MKLSLSVWFTEVPLVMLPGRESEFCSFSKVIFGRGEGAVAGVRGVAAVVVRFEGLLIVKDEGGHDDDEGTDRGVDGGLVLSGMPFHGSVRVGGKGCVESGGACVTCTLLFGYLIVSLRVESVQIMLPGAPFSFVHSSAVFVMAKFSLKTRHVYTPIHLLHTPPSCWERSPAANPKSQIQGSCRRHACAPLFVVSSWFWQNNFGDQRVSRTEDEATHHARVPLD